MSEKAINMIISGAFTVLVIVVISLLVVEINSDSHQLVKEQQATEKSLRQWNKTKEGVRYFTTCINGHLLVATMSTHNYEQLAGPIGECDDE
jgi:hypothetical protein